MRILENDIERDATPEEEEFFNTQLAAIAAMPKPLQEQINDVESQTLDIAEAVTSMFEMLLTGVNA